VLLLLASSAGAQSWTEPVEVRSGMQRCVTYRAALQGEYLVIEAVHEPSWHTYAMDNVQRATRQLAGQPSLGVELPTEIELGAGLTAVAPWYQSTPKDLSRPDIQWYTWGFEGRARFVVKVRQTGMTETTLRIRGQVCDSSSCLSVDVSLPVRLSQAVTAAPTDKLDMDGLVVVQESGQASPTPQPPAN
jgi:hypothetical protein